VSFHELIYIYNQKNYRLRLIFSAGFPNNTYLNIYGNALNVLLFGLFFPIKKLKYIEIDI
jgi:hypothetical protein